MTVPEHENFESIIRELEPTRDESVPQDINQALEHAQLLMASIERIEQRTGRSALTAKAKHSVMTVAKQIAIHHAIGGREE